jgi:hypothetical protein
MKVALVLGAALLVLAGCATQPITGKANCRRAERPIYTGQICDELGGEPCRRLYMPSIKPRGCEDRQWIVN